jgi:4-diphosphocytidyl-2-C-methyl-D-erythritol kinase
LRALTLKAPAKINLTLNILGKREDSYHEIYSLMENISLFDALTFFKIREGIVLKSNLPQLPLDRRNLVYQAAQLILNEGRVNHGAKIILKKKIPLSSGLGGGSSDAAFALLGLNRLYNLNFSLQKLHSLAEKLGSDIPFFLYQRTALVQGRGEKVKPVETFKDYWIVLITFPFQVSTSWAYRLFKMDLTRKPNFIKLKNLKKKEDFFGSLNYWRNDFEDLIVERYPQVKQVLKLLTKLGAKKSSMTGSGPTVYGIFEDEPSKEEVKKLLQRDDWKIFITRPIH